MEMPFMGDESCDDFFSGQAAALAGGTTMHIDFALPDSAGDLAAGYEAYTKKAEKSCMDYGFHMAVTKWNDKVAETMEWLVKEKGACHVKLMPWQTWLMKYMSFFGSIDFMLFVKYFKHTFSRNLTLFKTN
jgi:dihydroorotase-like cyclic amidohydrolase